jgi:hypothetical protein
MPKNQCLILDDPHQEMDEKAADILRQKVISHHKYLKKDKGYFGKVRLHESQIEDFLSLLTWFAENNFFNEIEK